MAATHFNKKQKDIVSILKTNIWKCKDEEK